MKVSLARRIVHLTAAFQLLSRLPAVCDVVPTDPAVADKFFLFDQVVTHRGNRQLHLNWDFQERLRTSSSIPTNWLAPESPFFDRGCYQFQVEVRRMERAWASPMHIQFGWWNIVGDPVIRHIAAPPLLLSHTNPPNEGQPWVYEQVGTIKSLDRKDMYYGAGPKQGKQVFDWDWRRAFAKNTAYTLLNPRDNSLDTDGDGKVSEAEFPDVEIHVRLTIHGPNSPLTKSLAPDSALVNGSGGFELQSLDTMILGPWLKAVGDLNGDRRTDIVVGGAEGGGLIAYFNDFPNWRREILDPNRVFSTDGEIADMDGDGREDVVAIGLKPAGLLWYKNSEMGWTADVITSNTLHDVEVADLDGDGQLDLVGRNQKEWPNKTDAGNLLYIFRQQRNGSRLEWNAATIACPAGEGLLLADVDTDGDKDIVINQRWYENVGGRQWTERTYASDADWNYPNTFIASADINGDGRKDIILSPSETQGHRYKISWFESPADIKSGTWKEHLVETNVETVVHFVGATDFNGDGKSDIAAAQMTQGTDPDDVTVFLNGGSQKDGAWNDSWTPLLLSTDGSHSMRILDADGDGRPDLFGANWRANKRDEHVKLWLNRLHKTHTSTKLPLDNWRRHIVDDNRPWPAVFVAPVDIDGDGLPDIVAGGWWYRNAGKRGTNWVRASIGEPLNNFGTAYDVDGDGDLDLFGTAWKGKPDPRLVWARNDGGGHLSVFTNIVVPDGREDFLQGAVFGRFHSRGVEGALSWHAGTGNGVQFLEVPADPARETWSWHRSSIPDQQEQLTASDLDRDGKLDLILGTYWLRNAGEAWTAHKISENSLQPDRNRAGDIDGDGQADVLVGYIGISRPGRLAWYGHNRDVTQPWNEHIVAEDVVGPMSLDLADMDGDGDLDIIVGEHNLATPAQARLLIFANLDGGKTWARHVVYTGDEHHDGAVVADMDGDGDLDIISVGWGHRRVLFYENLAR